MKKKKKAKANSFGPPNTLMSGIFDQAMSNGVAPGSLPFQLAYDNAYNPLTLNRLLLTYAYMTHGVIQTAINQPVEDAFRGGLDIQCDELSADDIDALNDYLDEKNVIRAIKDTMCWAKLFGGAGLIINTDQDPALPLDADAIGENSDLQFIDADRWELTQNYLSFEKVPCPYTYYFQPFHKSRVIKVLGKEAPSFLRRRLQGWGMSELERMIRPLQAYLKAEDVIYELLDEAKIDVWKLEGFNTQILANAAAGKTTQRLGIANLLKNYHRALIMDKDDDYEQKQIAFSGLAEILTQIRIGQAAAIRMPLTKLFGISAAGFNSGEDDIENYNSLIESEVRHKARTVVTGVLPLVCRKLFGFAPENISFEFKPLRVLSAEQEENVKTQKSNRYNAQYAQGLLRDHELAKINKQEGLCPIDTEVLAGADAEPPINPMAVDLPQKTVPGKVSEA